MGRNRSRISIINSIMHTNKIRSSNSIRTLTHLCSTAINMTVVALDPGHGLLTAGPQLIAGEAQGWQEEKQVQQE